MLGSLRAISRVGECTKNAKRPIKNQGEPVTAIFAETGIRKGKCARTRDAD